MSIPEADLADLVLRAARQLRRANAVELSGLAVNPHQARALRTIARLQPVRIAALAERLHVAPRSATDVVDALVDGGWVARTPDPGDRRAALLSLTPAGVELLFAVDAARARAAISVLGVLPADQRRAATDALSVLSSAEQETGPFGQGHRADAAPAPSTVVKP